MSQDQGKGLPCNCHDGAGEASEELQLGHHLCRPSETVSEKGTVLVTA